MISTKKEQHASEERNSLEVVRNAFATKISAPSSYDEAKHMSTELYRYRVMPIEWLFPKAAPVSLNDFKIPLYKEPIPPKEWDDLRRFDIWVAKEMCAIETALFHCMNKLVG